jgi:hypothetical protein
MKDLINEFLLIMLLNFNIPEIIPSSERNIEKTPADWHHHTTIGNILTFLEAS